MKLRASASILMALVVMSMVASGEMLNPEIGDGLACFCTQSMGQAQQNRYYYCNYNRVSFCTTSYWETEEYGNLTIRAVFPEALSSDCGLTTNRDVTVTNPFFRDNDDLLWLTLKRSYTQCCETPLCNA